MELDLTNFILSQFFIVAMLFCRVGTALLFMPGLGETYISPRIKVLFAVSLSIVLAPFIGVEPYVPDRLDHFLRIIIIETMIGLWIGVVGRILLTSLQSSVGAFQGATVLASFLMLGGVMIIFAADIHHIIIEAFVRSYQIFPIGQYQAGDFANQIALGLSVSTFLGFVIAAPYLVMGITVNVGLGLANRMMPTLPVFFVAVSILLGLGIYILSQIMSHSLQLFAEAFLNWLETFTFRE
jgi:flagellar biosynthetic protein FliR